MSPNRRKWPEKPRQGDPVKGPWECRGIPGSDGGSSPRGSRTRSASSCSWCSRPMSSAHSTPLHGWTGALTTTVACLAGVVGLAGAAVRPPLFRVALMLAVVAVVLAVLSWIADDLHLLGASSSDRDGAPASRGRRDPEGGAHRDQGRIPHDPRRDQRLHDPRAALHLPLCGDRSDTGKPLLRLRRSVKGGGLPLLQLHHADHHRVRGPRTRRAARAGCSPGSRC